MPPKPAPAPAAARPQKPKTVKSPAARGPAAAIVPNKDEAFSPVEAGLTEAFGGDDTSFTETMTGIVTSVGKSISSLKKLKGEKKSSPEAKPASASSGGSLFTNPKVLGIGAGALLAIVGVSYWIFGGSDERAVVEETAIGTPSFAEADPVSGITPPVGVDTSVSDLLEEARLATAAGQLFNPPGGNAIELYWSALQISPNDSAIASELDTAIEQSLSLAESALLESRVEDAAAALQRIALVRPGNSRLPFLNAQLAQVQLRNYLDDARLSIRESRFEDARFALDGARSLVVTDASEIDAVADELSAALSSQRVGDVLEKANARLADGLLIAPSNDNARYYYELALSTDPGNTAARQGLAVIASKLVLQARMQIDAQNFDEADALLADARRLDPSSSELIASTAALQSARDQLAQRQAAAAQQAADKRAADKLAADKLAADKLAADKLAAEQAAAEERAANERELAAQQAATENAEPIQEATTTESSAEPEGEAVLTAPDAEPIDVVAAASNETPSVDAETVAAVASQQSQPSVNDDTPVAVSSLQRIKYVAPKYPRAAQRRNVSGWVDVIFTVDIDGSVTNISVRDSNPGDTFITSATNAVEAWRFEPVIENGVAIQKRAAVRMMFALE